MKILHVVVLCCFSVVYVEASAVLQVSGRVGGGVSIHCSGSQSSDNSPEHYNMYFCKGLCSGENALIQTERKRLAITRRGRYSMEVSRGEGAFDVTIKRLRRADAGTYYCGVEKSLNTMHQEVNLIVLDASTVRPGSPPSTPTLHTEAETLPRGSFPSSTEETPASSTQPATQEKTKHQAANTLTGTTVVIIVSVSLALLVCAAIPLIFCGHCRSEWVSEGSTTNDANKDQADYCEENADVALTQAAVRLQSLEPEAQDASQYAAIYQALDPKSLD